MLYTNNNEPFAGKTKNAESAFMDRTTFLKNLYTENLVEPRYWISIRGKNLCRWKRTDENINQLAAGISLGYQLLAPLMLQASYGRIWFNTDNGHLFRVGATLAVPSKSDREMLKSLQNQAH
jgi:hypothetical protein